MLKLTSKISMILLSLIVISGTFHATFVSAQEPISTSTSEIGPNDFQISDMDYYYVTEAAVAYNKTNNEYLVVWVGIDIPGTEWQEIFVQRLDGATGAEIGSDDVRVSDMGPSNNFDYYAANPAVIYNETANEYLVLWVGSDVGKNEWEVYGQRLDGATGAEIGVNDFRISDMGPDGNADYGAGWVAAAYNPTQDEYMVVWTGDDDTSPIVDDEWEIFGQRLSANGAEIGANDFRISDMGPDGNVGYQVETLDIVYNSTNDEYLVVWEGDDNTPPLVNDEHEIFGQRLSADGAEIGSNDFRISDMGPDGDFYFNAHRPEAAYNDAAGEYLVIWGGDDAQFGLVEDEFEIFGQRLNAATGAEIGANDFRISDMGPDKDFDYEARRPEIAYSKVSNEYLVVWRGEDDTPPLVDGEREIFGQRLNTNGVQIGDNDFRISDMGPDGDPNFGVYTYVSVGYNSTNDEYLTVWSGDDTVDDEYEIFGQRVLAGNCHAQLASLPNTTYHNIQSAVDAAGNGDTVKVAGTCTGVQNRAGTNQIVYIDKNITIQGGYTTTNWLTPDSITNPTKLDARNQGRVVYLANNISATLKDLQITGGGNEPVGAGIYLADATLTLKNSTVFSNTVQNLGGGLFIEYNAVATVNIENTTFSNNRANHGGGIANFGLTTTVTISNSTFIDNEATTGYGGGTLDAVNGPHTYNIQGSSFTGNTAGAGGGAIDFSSSGGTMSITNTTISGNRANENGGGIESDNNTDTINLNNVTIVNNIADEDGDDSGDGGGINRVTGVYNIANSIIAQNSDNSPTNKAPDCAGATGTIVSAGYNLIGDTNGCNWSEAAGDITGTTASPVDPILDALTGSPGYHALQADSPAVDAGNPGSVGASFPACAATDQPGQSRPTDGDGDGTNRCDIGAFEFEGLPEEEDSSVYLPLVIKQPATPTPTPTPEPNDFVSRVIAETNTQRTQNGCSPLAENTLLNQAAQKHSEDMALNDFFSHTGSDGSQPDDRVAATGYQFSRLAENIARGYATPEAAVEAWMNSDGHRANILNCNLTEIGVGYYFLENDTGETTGNHYWTQVFGTPAN